MKGIRIVFYLLGVPLGVGDEIPIHGADNQTGHHHELHPTGKIQVGNRLKPVPLRKIPQQGQALPTQI